MVVVDGYVHMSVSLGACRGRERVVSSPELEFQSFVNLGCSSAALRFGLVFHCSFVPDLCF